MEASPIEPAAPVASPLTRRASVLRRRAGALRASDTGQAAGLALATIAQQLLAVVYTVLFTRLLGAGGYGALAALINLTVILLVPGSALQVVVARQGTLGRLGHGAELAGTLDRWTRHALVALAAVAVVAAVAREPLAALLNVDQVWAAATVPVCATLWLLISAQRGLLQAARAYRPVALSLILESVGRITGGLALVAVGLDVTGAFLGLLVAFAAIAAMLHRSLRGRLGRPARGTPRHPLSDLVRRAAVPIAGLVVVAALQNVDVIVARHSLNSHEAGVYAATTVAAKFIVWVAVGIGLWVLPEATRRAAAGHDPRPVLLKGLAVIGVLTVPSLATFVAIPGPLLEVAFGPAYRAGDQVLPELGVAFALLACGFVAVQFLLGLHRRVFVVLLGVIAVAEPLLLLGAGTLESFASRVLVVQAAAATVALGLGLAARRDAHPASGV